MEDQPSDSFKFMEELVATWLEGAHRTEITRVLDAIKAELRRRAQADAEPWPSSAGRELAPRPPRPAGPHLLADEGPAEP